MDCYNESEQVTGLYTMIDEYLAVPFQTSVLGVLVTVEMVDLTDAEEIVIVCRAGGRASADCRPRPPPAVSTPGWLGVDRGLSVLG